MAAKWEEIFALLGLFHERVNCDHEDGSLLLRVFLMEGVDTSFECCSAIDESWCNQNKTAPGISSLDALPAEVDVLKQKLATKAAQVRNVQQVRDEQASPVRALEAEKLATAKGTEELKQQLVVQSVEVQMIQEVFDEQAARIKELQTELAQQTGNLAAMAQALQRLRQLAAPSTP